VKKRALARSVLLLASAACGTSSSSGSPFGDPLVTGDAASETAASSQTDALASSVSDGAGAGFALPEGASGASGCQAGTYAGQYTGTFQTIVPTTGPVTIVLTKSTVSVGENELVTNGGTWNTTWGPSAGDASLPVEDGHAQLVGQLDCNADTFTAMGQNAYFTILGQDAGTFTLSLTGTYDPAAETISGMFTYVSTDGSGGGTWQVTLTEGGT
jgi:hypothetical protein